VSRNDRKIITEAYLQIRRKTRNGYETYSEGVVERVTSKRPDTPAPGCVVVKVQINVPLAAFEPLTPEVVIDVPEDLVQHPVEVVAQ